MDAKEISEEDSGNHGNIDAEASIYHEAPAAVSRDDECTHRKTEYFMTMDIDVKNIDEYDEKIWKIIHETIDENCL